MAPSRPIPAGLLIVAALLAAACAAPVASQGVGDTAAHHYAIGMKFIESNELARAEEEFRRAQAPAPKDPPALEGPGPVALARAAPAPPGKNFQARGAR